MALDDEAFDPAGYLSASARTIAMEPDGRFSLPAEFASVLEVGDGVMLVGKGDKFQLWNPGRWQARRDSDRDKMAAFVRGAGRRRRMSGACHVPVLAHEVVDALQAARRRPLCRRHVRRRRLHRARCSIAPNAR